MPELESQQTAVGFEVKATARGDTNDIKIPSAPLAEGLGDVAEGDPVRGISVIPIPRREIAHLRGTFRLSELPRHKPTVVFDTGRQFRDAGDE
jgi:hypothetical protein